MACFRPMTAYRFPGGPAETLTRNGKPALFFGKRAEKWLLQYGALHEVLTIPCGKCIFCVMKRSADWALRCVHEIGFWETGCFLTLTYATDKLPRKEGFILPTVVVKHFQDFMKRLRIYLVREENVNAIKYFACGEYGDKTERPHYHALVFGWKPRDMVQVPNNPGTADALFDSETVAKLWGHGRVRIGTLTRRSAAYVARYTVKKQYGEKATALYEATGRTPPFLLCSQGIGRGYFLRWRSDIYPSDFIVDEENFRRNTVPRFYDRLLEAADKQEYEAVKKRRMERASKFYKEADNTVQRLAVREECAVRKLEFAKQRGGTES